MSPLRSLIFLICLFAGIVPAAAETLPIDAFFGRWGGSAIGQSVTTSTMGYGARDLDVTISGTAEGFDITWITVIKPSGVEQDSEGHRRTSTASFLRSVGPDRGAQPDRLRLRDRWGGCLRPIALCPHDLGLGHHGSQFHTGPRRRHGSSGHRQPSAREQLGALCRGWVSPREGTKSRLHQYRCFGAAASAFAAVS
jgi:hypothetical protein